jgi:hypothetical protein
VERSGATVAKAKAKVFRVLHGPDDNRVEGLTLPTGFVAVGEVTEMIPTTSRAWLTARGYIEPVSDTTDTEV